MREGGCVADVTAARTLAGGSKVSNDHLPIVPAYRYCWNANVSLAECQVVTLAEFLRVRG